MAPRRRPPKPVPRRHSPDQRLASSFTTTSPTTYSSTSPALPSVTYPYRERLLNTCVFAQRKPLPISGTFALPPFANVTLSLCLLRGQRRRTHPRHRGVPILTIALSGAVVLIFIAEQRLDIAFDDLPCVSRLAWLPPSYSAYPAQRASVFANHSSWLETSAGASPAREDC